VTNGYVDFGDFNGIGTNGSGGVRIYAKSGSLGAFIVSFSASGSSFDGGDITTDGSGDLTANGRITGKLNTSATVSGTPSGGNSGDIVIDTTANKLWIKFGANWKSVTLT
jgi:hypothetical protein